jgi:formylglycine-generating enzyme required for sulfatase activity
LMDDMQKDARSLRLYVRKLLSISGETNLLLVVDQFEETFTLCKDPAERKAFIENLLSLAEQGNSTSHVVITLRADFYHHCAEYEGLRLALEKHQAYIGAMTTDELREAITIPAEKNGWYFQPGLVDLILGDVGMEPGALPLLSHALLETWKRRQGRTLTLQGYAEAGGVKKAIARTAESVYDSLSPAEQAIARGIFLRLTELGEGVQDTRRRVKMDELAQAKEQEAVAKVLKTLTDARLVTTEQDNAEVAHEALIREWGTLRKWLDEDRESLRLHRHLTESATEWQRRGREASELYRGTRLEQIREWVRQHGDSLSPLESEFVKASQNVKKREQLRWVGVAVAGVALLLMVVLGVTGNLNRFIYRPVDMADYWVPIPAGEFQMGSEGGNDDEKPVHTVYLDTFEIGRYEVTTHQYAQCVKANICPAPDVAEVVDLHPVANVSWFNAQTFCEWVGGRLPTEAEWEKAASWDDQAKTKRMYPWGETIGCTYANYYDGNKFCVGYITDVGSYESGKSPYGLYDMAGNVQEWVNDLYSDTYYQISPSSNPLGPPPLGSDTGPDRVLRGGSWGDSNNSLRSAYRSRKYPLNADVGTGFRCARSQ